MAPISVGSTANHTAPMQNTNAAIRGNAPSAENAAARFLASILNATRAAPDQAAADKERGKPSSRAGRVETEMRQAFKSWISEDTPRVAAKVRVLDNREFEKVYLEAGGEKDITAVNGFTQWDSDGTVRRIWVREGADNQETLTHEFLHAYASPEFKSVGQRFVVGSGQDRSDLSEGAVKFLTARLMGDAQHGPKAQSASIVSDIVETMTVEKTADAFFHGNDGAIEAFEELAAGVPEVVVNEKAPPRRIEEMMAFAPFAPPARTGIPLRTISVDLADRIRRKAAEVTKQIMDEHDNALVLGTTSSVSVVSDRANTLLVIAAHQHLQTSIDNAKGDLARRAAAQAAHAASQNGEIVRGIMNATPQLAPYPQIRQSLGQVHWSDNVSVLSTTPMWKRNQAQGLAELAAAEAFKTLGNQLTVWNDPAFDRAGDRVNSSLTDTMNDFFKVIQPGFLENVVYRTAEAILQNEAERFGPGRDDQYRAIDRINDPGFDLKARTSTALKNWGMVPAGPRVGNAPQPMRLSQNPETEVLEGSFLKSAGEYAAAEVAREAFGAPDVQQVMETRAVQDAPRELRAALEAVPPAAPGAPPGAPPPLSLLQSYAATASQPTPAAGGRPGEHLGFAGAEWNADRNAVRQTLTQYAQNIVTAALRNYERARGPVARHSLVGDDREIIAQHVNAAMLEVETGLNTANPLPAAQQEDRRQQLMAAEKIARRAFQHPARWTTFLREDRWTTYRREVRNYLGPPGDDTALRNARARLLEGINNSIESHVNQTTEEATNVVRKQPETRQFNAAPGQGAPVAVPQVAPPPVGATPPQIAAHVAAIATRNAQVALAAQNAAIRRSGFSQSRIVTKTNELNFFPDPMADGKLPRTWIESAISWLAPAISWFAPPFKGGTKYSRDYFKREMLPLLPDDLKAALAPALQGENGVPDKATKMLGHVPYGLTAIIADIHAHPFGYDRREGDQFNNMLDQAHPNGRVTFNCIPQFCGGASHYSTSAPTAATMRKAPELDLRVIHDWLKAYRSGNYRRAARADISATGMSFGPNPPIKHDAFTDPVKYLKELNIKELVDFVSAGELTGIKELISKQLGNWRWNVGSEKFQKFLGLLGETGQLLILHNDWGDHALSAEGRPTPAKQNYEHFDGLKFVFGRPEYQNVQVIFAHTGIGRFVRPNDAMSTRTHVIKKWEWDPETGTGKVTSEVTKQVTAPEHIHKVYELFEAAPNAMADISWNEVTQAYMDLMHANPAAADAIVDLFIDHQDRILFGSDIIKPVSEGHYHQSLMTGAPLFAEIARRDLATARTAAAAAAVAAGASPAAAAAAAANLTVEDLVARGHLTEEKTAAFKILRGNYDKATDRAYKRLYKWKLKNGVPEGRPDEPDSMAGRRENLTPQRELLHRDAWNAFRGWAHDLDRLRIAGNPNPVNWNPNSPDFASAPIGLYPAFFEKLRLSTHMEQDEGSVTGLGTAGGKTNDSTKRHWGAEGLNAGLFGISALATFGVSKALAPPTDSGAIVVTLAGANATDDINDAAFLARALLGLGRIVYTENLRLEWETIYEQGVVTRPRLDAYITRLFEASPYLNITAAQRLQIAAATEQFWANYCGLRDAPLDPAKGWTERKKNLDIQAKVSAFQGAIGRLLHVQDSSIDATDARRPEGQWFRAAMLATYGVNTAVAAKWLATDGLKEFGNVRSLAEAIFRMLFFLGNAMLGTQQGRAIAGGLLGLTDKETDAWARGLLVGGTSLLSAGGVAWTLQTGLTAIEDFLVKSGGATEIHMDHAAGSLDVITAVLKAMFTAGAAGMAYQEYKRISGGPLPKPAAQASPALLMLGALGLAMIFGLAAGI